MLFFLVRSQAPKRFSGIKMLLSFQLQAIHRRASHYSFGFILLFLRFDFRQRSCQFSTFNISLLTRTYQAEAPQAIASSGAQSFRTKKTRPLIFLFIFTSSHQESRYLQRTTLIFAWLQHLPSFNLAKDAPCAFDKFSALVINQSVQCLGAGAGTRSSQFPIYHC